MNEEDMNDIKKMLNEYAAIDKTIEDIARNVATFYKNLQVNGLTKEDAMTCTAFYISTVLGGNHG